MSTGVWSIDGNGVARAKSSSHPGNHVTGTRNPDNRFITTMYSIQNPRISSTQKDSRLMAKKPRKFRETAARTDTNPSR
ncbi:hypothetical protein D3C73_1578670 [compost metagenome]